MLDTHTQTHMRTTHVVPVETQKEAQRCHLKLSETHCSGQKPKPLRGAGGGTPVFTVDMTAKSEGRLCSLAADYASEWDPAVMAPLFWVPDGVTRACESQQLLG